MSYRTHVTLPFPPALGPTEPTAEKVRRSYSHRQNSGSLKLSPHLCTAGKGKDVSIHTMKAYGGNECTARIILNPGIRQR
jgi:hypothetical protein